MMRFAAVRTLVIASLAARGCGSGAPSTPQAGARPPGQGPTCGPLLVVGVDGLEWDVLLDLLARGTLPTVARIMQQGSFGLLETVRPTSSPIIWTTIATGKPKEQHGIEGFARRDESGRRTALYSNRDRKTKAVWNILCDYGQRVGVVGWWMTYPVEPIHGVMVAQTNTLDRQQGWKGRLMPGLPGQVHPPQRQAEMLALLEQSEARLDELTVQIFGAFRHPLSELDRGLWDKSRWAFRADATYHQIALRLLGERPAFDVLLVYFGGTDVVGHRFWRYYQPELYRHPPSAEQLEDLGGVLPSYYAYVDRVVGELLAAAPPNVSLLLLSDHGMHGVNRQGTYDNSAASRGGGAELSGHHRDAPPGALLAMGPFVRRMGLPRSVGALRREGLTTVGTVMDIAPTILAAMRIPLGRDMEGRVLERLFTPEFDIARQPPPVDTHDTPEFRAERPKPPQAGAGERERMEQLKALGYIGDDD